MSPAGTGDGLRPGALTFDGRVAIVTGAGRGLGRAHAVALAARGAAVVVNDIGTEIDGRGSTGRPADDVVSAITAAGGRAVASYHDVADREQAQALVESTADEFGRVDVVVNNAGIFRGGRFATQPAADFEAVIGTHLLGSANVTRVAWGHMRAQQYGRVVMTASAAGLWGGADASAYAAAKAGLVGLTMSLADEGRDDGILVNAVSPGAETRLSTGMFTRPGSRRWRPELVTPAVLYLAHEGCGHTGEVFAAVAGRFARVQVVQAPGHAFDARGKVEPEDVVAHLDAITAMDGAESYLGRMWQSLGLAADGDGTRP